MALISGGARGIGSGVARALAEQGHRVVITAREIDRAEAAARELAEGAPGEVRGLPLEVTDDASVAGVIDSIRATEGRLDALVNNAGFVGGYERRAAEVDLDEAASVLETNLFGAWRLTQASLPLPGSSTSPWAWASSRRWARARSATDSRRLH